jgi:molecular chaperone DnaK (HSP70)
MAKEEAASGRQIGIDLGTTNSVTAVFDMDRVKILHNMDNEQQTRSVIGYDEGEILIGSPALRNWPLAPKDTIISIKRLMGRAYTDPEVIKMKQHEQQYKYDIVEPSNGTKDSVSVMMGGKEYSPVDVSAMLLSKLKKDAEFVLGQEVTHAVITVPAYFSEKQKHATREAGLRAGLTVMKVLDEPTAAAIAFGIDSQEQEAKTVLVFDLGGGTFDISVLMMTAGTIAPINLEGDMWLGGDNFDQVIIDFVLKKINQERSVDPTSNDRFMASLKLEAQKAKETLSSARTARIIVPGILNDSSGNIVDIKETITREQFEDMIDTLIKGKIVPLVKKAVENANLSIEDVDHVLMAGNSSCIPKVQQAMEELFGTEKILRKVHPKNSVAIGAAITAVSYGYIDCPKCGHNNFINTEKCEKCDSKLKGIKEKKLCPNCQAENAKDATTCAQCGNDFFELVGPEGGPAPFHYGIQSEGDKFNVFIEKSDQYPTPEEKKIVQTFYTLYPNQRWISIPIYGGDHLDAASKNEKQGEAFAILAPNHPEGTAVRVKLWLNKQGIFELSAQLDDGTDLKPWILRGDIDQEALEIMQKCEEARGKKEQILSPPEKQKAEKMRDEILNKMQNKKFKEAKDDANKLLDHMDKAGKIEDPLQMQAEGLIGFVNFVVNEYGWLLGQAGYQLNQSKGELQEAVKKNDRPLMEKKLKELSGQADKLMRTTDRTGKPVPTLLGTFIALHGAIASIVQPGDPVEAQNLREELKAVETAYKNKDPQAAQKLNTFAAHLEQAIKKAKERHPEGQKCRSCGHYNPFGMRNCAKCKADLWIMGNERASSVSNL